MSAAKGSRVNEVWLDKAGKKITVQWNPCNCHPNDVTMIWGRGFKQAGSYVNQNKSAWTKRLKKRGWTRIERVIL